MKSFGDIEIGDTFKYGDSILMKIRTVKVEVGRHPEAGSEYNSMNAVCICDEEQVGSLAYMDDDMYCSLIGFYEI